MKNIVSLKNATNTSSTRGSSCLIVESSRTLITLCSSIARLSIT